MKEKIKDFVVMTLGTLIAGVGIYFFKFPNNFSTGGVSGLAIILAKIIPNISIGQMVLMINIALLIIGFIFLGKSFGGKTVYCSLLLSFSLTILEK
ncbi:MAG: YitT family protein, partial [Oscillospiraceae bacterium]